MTHRKYALPAALFAFSLMAGPLAQAQTQAAPPPRPHHAMSEQDEAAMIERHIAHMHDALKVTAAQEDSWKPVAQTMRDNEKMIHDIVKDRTSKMDTQSAADDLNAWSDIAAAHAQASRKLADVFSVFYASLGDDQKKVADDFFRQHKRDHGPMHGPMHGNKGPDAKP